MTELNLTLPARFGVHDASPHGKALRTHSLTPSRFSGSCTSPFGQTLRSASAGLLERPGSTGSMGSTKPGTPASTKSSRCSTPQINAEEYIPRLCRSQDVNCCGLNRHTRVSHVVELPNRLQHEDVTTRLRAVLDLGLMGSGGGTHASIVADKLDDPSPAVRKRAHWTLKKMTMPVLRPHIAKVAKKLQHKDANVRAMAADLLGDMSYKAEFDQPMKDAMIEVSLRLSDPDVQVRRNALEALCKCGKTGQLQHIDKVAKSLHDQDNDCRRLALTVMGKIGKAALPHTEAVVELLRDGDFRIRQAAIVTLAEMRRI